MKAVASSMDFFCGVFFLISLLIDANYNGAEVVVPLVMFVYHIWKIIQFKGSVELGFLLLFSMTYPLFWLLSLILTVDIHYLFFNVDARLVAKVFSAQGLFLACLFLGMRNKSPTIISQHPRRNSSVVFWGCVMAMVFCLVIAVGSIKGSVFQQSYDYEVRSSILFEYVLILIIVAYAYSGDRRLRRIALVLISLMFVLAPLYFGRRLPASMVAFSLLLLFWRPKSLKRVIAIFVAGFVVLSFVALYRAGQSGQSILDAVLNVGEHGAMRNNQGGVVYSSAVYMKLTELGFFDLIFGVKSMANTALSIFLPSSMVGQSAYINFSAMEHIPIPGNGGLPGVGFYVWGRAIAVVLMGLFLGWLMMRSRYNYLSSVYVSFLFFSFPRWMAYNVNFMFKGGVLLIVGWVLVRLVVQVARCQSPLVSSFHRN